MSNLYPNLIMKGSREIRQSSVSLGTTCQAQSASLTMPFSQPMAIASILGTNISGNYPSSKYISSVHPHAAQVKEARIGGRLYKPSISWWTSTRIIQDFGGQTETL